MPEQPNWRELPDRTSDAAIKRRAWQRGVIAGAKRATKGRSYQFLRVLSISPRLFRPYLLWNARLMPRGRLDRKLTEVVIIRTAWLCGSRYEWTQHRAIGKSVGLTEQQIDAAGAEPDSDVLDDRMRPLLAAIPELLDDHALAEDTHDRLREFLSPAELLEFIMLVGTYSALAGALNSFGAPLESAWSKRR